MELYGPANVINTVELPINPAARPVFYYGHRVCQRVVRLPGRQVGHGTQSMNDATVQERTDCAADAKPLP